MYRNRRNFLRLRELASELITIPEAPADDVSTEIRRHIHRSRIAKLTRIPQRLARLREAR